MLNNYVCYGQIILSKKIPGLVQRTSLRTKLRTSLAHKACAQSYAQSYAQSKTRMRTKLTGPSGEALRTSLAHKPAHKAKRTSLRTKQTFVYTKDFFSITYSSFVFIEFPGLSLAFRKFSIVCSQVFHSFPNFLLSFTVVLPGG